MIRKFGVLLVAIILLGVLAGCGAKSDDIVIASANPMTGDSAQFGDMKVKAIQLALDEVNAAGGIDGKNVKLLVGDDTGNPKEAPNVAQKFSSDNNVLAVIGHWNSSATLAARGIYDSAKIPVITDSVNKAITDGSTPYIFRISLTDTVQAEQLAVYAVEKMGAKKIAVLYANNDFGNGIKEDFANKAKALGAEIVIEETYFEGQSKDFSPQLTKIRNANPDLIFVPGYYVETALIAQQRLSAGMDIPMLGTDGISSEELIKLGGQAVEGIKFTGFFHPEQNFLGTAEFVNAFKAKYNKEPDTYAALAYDSAKLILAGIEANGATREGLYDYLTQVSGYEGIAGPITFDEYHDVTRNIIMLTVKNGEIVPAEDQL